MPQIYADGTRAGAPKVWQDTRACAPKITPATAPRVSTPQRPTAAATHTKPRKGKQCCSGVRPKTGVARRAPLLAQGCAVMEPHPFLLVVVLLAHMFTPCGAFLSNTNRTMSGGPRLSSVHSGVNNRPFTYTVPGATFVPTEFSCSSVNCGFPCTQVSYFHSNTPSCAHSGLDFLPKMNNTRLVRHV